MTGGKAGCAEDSPQASELAIIKAESFGVIYSKLYKIFGKRKEKFEILC